MPYLRKRPELLAAFRRGLRAALEEVYWAYVEAVDLRARRLVARADVPDVVQDVFLRAFRDSSRAAYDGERDYTPYLVTIARNLVADRARRAGREIATDELPERSQEEEEPWADPLTMRVVEQYLAALPAPLKDVHEARYVRDLSQRDAAEAIGISRQQLRTREGELRAGLAAALRTRS